MKHISHIIQLLVNRLLNLNIIVKFKISCNCNFQYSSKDESEHNRIKSFSYLKYYTMTYKY